MAGQSIRPSQFITTYGVGSVLEGPDGPAVIASFEKSGLFVDPSAGGGVTPQRFQIVEPRLEALVGGRLFRIPTNDALGEKGNTEIYQTFAFPRWSLCVERHHNIIYRLDYDPKRSSNTGCPDCGPRSPGDAWRKARREAISFVQACTNGHLDDIDWPNIFSHKAGCRGRELRWIGGGSGLRTVMIQCRECHEGELLGIIVSRGALCRGNLPESRTKEPCDRHAAILQRGATNLRLPDTASAVSIPPVSTALHNVLLMSDIQSALIGQPDPTRITKAALLGILARLKQFGKIGANQIATVDSASEDEIRQAIQDTLKVHVVPSQEAMLEEELEALKRAADKGAPASPTRNPANPHHFEVIASEIRPIPMPSGRTLRVTPINRLRVVIAQLGYTRPVDTKNAPLLQKRALSFENSDWYPAVELMGEGIFIDFEGRDPHFELEGEDAQAWRSHHVTTGEPADHPVFVWWHTFAHRLLQTLSVDSGYSSASLRERVFVQVDPATRKAYGGILIYTAQQGGDGTLGGLVALVPRFEDAMRRALVTLDSCSNDPICEEERFEPGHANGAACYACQLVSETSCEHLNRNLDRNVLRRNRP